MIIAQRFVFYFLLLLSDHLFPINKIQLPSFFLKTENNSFSLIKKETIIFLTSSHFPNDLLKELKEKSYPLFVFKPKEKEQLTNLFSTINPDYIILPLHQERLIQKILKENKSSKKPIAIFYPSPCSKKDLLLKQLTFSEKGKIKASPIIPHINFKEKLVSSFNKKDTVLIFEIKKGQGKEFLKDSLKKRFSLDLDYDFLSLSLTKKDLEQHLSKIKTTTYILLPEKKTLSLEDKKKVNALEKKLFSFLRKNPAQLVFIQRYRSLTQEPWNFSQESTYEFALHSPKQFLKKKEKQLYFIKKFI